MDAFLSHGLTLSDVLTAELPAANYDVDGQKNHCNCNYSYRKKRDFQHYFLYLQCKGTKNFVRKRKRKRKRK